MAVPPQPHPQLQPPTMGAAEVADHVWIEARRQHVATLNQQPQQEDQPVYLRFLARASAQERTDSWQRGLQGLPMPRLHGFAFDDLQLLLEQRFQQEAQNEGLLQQ